MKIKNKNTGEENQVFDFLHSKLSNDDVHIFYNMNTQVDFKIIDNDLFNPDWEVTEGKEYILEKVSIMNSVADVNQNENTNTPQDPVIEGAKEAEKEVGEVFANSVADVNQNENTNTPQDPVIEGAKEALRKYVGDANKKDVS
jgi:hypothetical protein